MAIEVAEQIINKGEVSRGYLGVRMSEVDSDLAQALGMENPMELLLIALKKINLLIMLILRQAMSLLNLMVKK